MDLFGMIGSPSAVGSISVDFDGVDQVDLSPWFNPFLRQFAHDAQRCGGDVRVIREAGAIAALMVSDPVERVASVFSRSRSIAEAFVRERGPYGMYSDFSFEPSAEVFDIFTTALDADRLSYRFRHPVRPFSNKDLHAVVDLMREVHGPLNERWLEGLPTASETGFLAEVDGRLTGVGWVSKVGTHARLHSLAVRAPYRRMGLGTDLLFARLLWARQAGASEVLSEISQSNVASQAIASRGGMQRVGQIYFYRPL
jgi:GNAT superfamily N-acetyltransferase